MNNCFYLILILFFASFSQLKAQNPDFSEYREIDRHANKAPDSIANNILDLHTYLSSGAISKEEEIRAFYMWVIKNIKYQNQVELMYDPNFHFYMGTNNCSAPVCVLRDRKAVCEGFSKLFQALCQYSGIEAYSITGYISKNGTLQDRATHSWNVVNINNEWRFFDLSWASAVLFHSGIKRKTNEFFMVAPDEFIITHLPLIPMWQFIATPISIKEFNAGDDEIQKFLSENSESYNYMDSLNAFNKLSYKNKRLKTAADICIINPGNKFNLAIEYFAYSRLILNYEGDIGPYEYYELIKARKKINLAIDLFKNSKDISSKIMVMNCTDHLDRINARLDFASSYIRHIK